MDKKFHGRCPYCFSRELKYIQQSWTTTEDKTVRLTTRCESCEKVSVWKLEELMGD